MKNEIVELEEVCVIGISVRTTNQEGKSQRDIGELFGAFTGGNLIERIPNKINNDIYCIYTEYESDFNAPYTTVIGCKVTTLNDVPTGLIGLTIPATKYQVFKSTGRLPECVGETWFEIWQSDINRQYVADFDVYGEKAQNPNDAEVETFVSIK
ncbi:MAG: AraC family transcriptional regulator [Acidobacteria bacterium]|jgi:predicted transcriptional regulator YdeE|nr:AraC family transcriptional regulator [Acidobacteriota bacterium]